MFRNVLRENRNAARQVRLEVGTTTILTDDAVAFQQTRLHQLYVPVM